jgi:hypothetical protein
MIDELLSRLFHARTNAHILHLKTKSYAAHKALNDFYDAIPDFADSIAEAYQGDYGLITWRPATLRYVHYEDALELLEELGLWINEHRGECCDSDDTYLQNIIDEVMALIRSTQYKLKYLK